MAQTVQNGAPLDIWTQGLTTPKFSHHAAASETLRRSDRTSSKQKAPGSHSKSRDNEVRLRSSTSRRKRRTTAATVDFPTPNNSAFDVNALEEVNEDDDMSFLNPSDEEFSFDIDGDDLTNQFDSGFSPEVHQNGRSLRRETLSNGQSYPEDMSMVELSEDALARYRRISSFNPSVTNGSQERRENGSPGKRDRIQERISPKPLKQRSVSQKNALDPQAAGGKPTGAARSPPTVDTPSLQNGVDSNGYRQQLHERTRLVEETVAAADPEVQMFGRSASSAHTHHHDFDEGDTPTEMRMDVDTTEDFYLSEAESLNGARQGTIVENVHDPNQAEGPRFSFQVGSSAIHVQRPDEQPKGATEEAIDEEEDISLSRSALLAPTPMKTADVGYGVPPSTIRNPSAARMYATPKFNNKSAPLVSSPLKNVVTFSSSPSSQSTPSSVLEMNARTEGQSRNTSMLSGRFGTEHNGSPVSRKRSLSSLNTETLPEEAEGSSPKESTSPLQQPPVRPRKRLHYAPSERLKEPPQRPSRHAKDSRQEVEEPARDELSEGTPPSLLRQSASIRFDVSFDTSRSRSRAGANGAPAENSLFDSQSKWAGMTESFSDSGQVLKDDVFFSSMPQSQSKSQSKLPILQTTKGMSSKNFLAPPSPQLEIESTTPTDVRISDLDESFTPLSTTSHRWSLRSAINQSGRVLSTVGSSNSYLNINPTHQDSTTPAPRRSLDAPPMFQTSQTVETDQRRVRELAAADTNPNPQGSLAEQEHPLDIPISNQSESVDSQPKPSERPRPVTKPGNLQKRAHLKEPRRVSLFPTPKKANAFAPQEDELVFEPSELSQIDVSTTQADNDSRRSEKRPNKNSGVQLHPFLAEAGSDKSAETESRPAVHPGLEFLEKDYTFTKPVVPQTRPGPNKRTAKASNSTAIATSDHQGAESGLHPALRSNSHSQPGSQQLPPPRQSTRTRPQLNGFNSSRVWKAPRDNAFRVSHGDSADEDGSDVWMELQPRVQAKKDNKPSRVREEQEKRLVPTTPARSGQNSQAPAASTVNALRRPIHQDESELLEDESFVTDDSRLLSDQDDSSFVEDSAISGVSDDSMVSQRSYYELHSVTQVPTKDPAIHIQQGHIVPRRRSRSRGSSISVVPESVVVNEPASIFTKVSSIFNSILPWGRPREPTRDAHQQVRYQPPPYPSHPLLQGLVLLPAVEPWTKTHYVVFNVLFQKFKQTPRLFSPTRPENAALLANNRPLNLLKDMKMSRYGYVVTFREKHLVLCALFSSLLLLADGDEFGRLYGRPINRGSLKQCSPVGLAISTRTVAVRLMSMMVTQKQREEQEQGINRDYDDGAIGTFTPAGDDGALYDLARLGFWMEERLAGRI